MPKVVDADARRSELIDAVAGQITKVGMDGVTMREVARAAGWTTGAVSHYFTDKRELVMATFHARADASRARIEAAVDAGANRLDALVDGSLAIDDERRADWRVFLAFWGAAIGNPELTKAQRERHRGFDRILVRAVREEQAAGHIRSELDATREARRLVALLDGIAVQALFQPGHWPPAEQRRCVADHLATLR